MLAGPGGEREGERDLCLAAQGLPQRWRFIQTFPLWQFVKFIYTGFALNYSASAFLVSPSILHGGMVIILTVKMKGIPLIT